MKKNIIGDIIAPKNPEKSWIKRLDLVPRLLCLLLALIVWLLVMNVQETSSEKPVTDPVGITEVIS